LVQLAAAQGDLQPFIRILHSQAGKGH
jgi:hypothetical protein